MLDNGQCWIDYVAFGGEMAGLFRKSLGIILLLATMGLATCQSMFNATSEKVENIAIEKPRGEL